MLKLVMFDLDGTLVDTAGEIADAVNDTLALLGQRTAPEALVRQWIGIGTAELMLSAYAWATGWSRSTLRGSQDFARALALFEEPYARRCGTRSRPYPGAAHVLAALRESGVATAVVTNKEERFARAVLAAHALAPDMLVGGDTLPRRKPDPLPLEHVMRRFEARPEQSLFIGDSQIDLRAARNATVPCWLVDYGYDNEPEARRAAPDARIASLAAVLQAPAPRAHAQPVRQGAQAQP